MSKQNGASAYFSIDVEADGPIPGPYSMLSIGAAFIGHQDDTDFYPVVDVAADVFYRELRPISDNFVPRALEVSGLDRDHLLLHGADPAQTMSELTTRVKEVAAGHGAPVFIGYPAGYDWLFTYWYLINFTGDSVFGHSRMLDIKSYYAGHSGRPLAGISKRTMPRELRSGRKHTHRADDDAMEQGELGTNLIRQVRDRVAGARVARQEDPA